ncbi:Cytokinin riboside 5'-monophosphate phosphoribohydrolase [Psidium guajava]|nr:Cytokinin riboside 5'-monophosphate phosphoribohydrolase [Psidium guajava]
MDVCKVAVRRNAYLWINFKSSFAFVLVTHCQNAGILTRSPSKS